MPIISPLALLLIVVVVLSLSCPSRSELRAQEAKLTVRASSMALSGVGPLLEFFELQLERGPLHEYSQENIAKLNSHMVDIRPIDVKQLESWLAALT